MQSKSHPKYGCKEIIPSRELGTDRGFMAWLVQCSQDSFFFLISDIKLEALRNQVASSGAHIPFWMPDAGSATSNGWGTIYIFIDTNWLMLMPGFIEWY